MPRRTINAHTKLVLGMVTLEYFLLLIGTPEQQVLQAQQELKELQEKQEKLEQQEKLRDSPELSH
jgi:hypothetical protein